MYSSNLKELSVSYW